MSTDWDGRPCQSSDDSFVAALFRLMPKSLEETVVFAKEDEGVPGVVRQIAGLQHHDAVDPNE